MKSTVKHIALAIAASLACIGAADAATSLNLGSYHVSATYGLDLLAGSGPGVSGLEASAVTYAKDRGSLFYVGDEGTGVVEISLTGQTKGTMAFDWTGTGSSKHDTEGLTYLGNGVLVVSEERLYDAYKFSYAANGSATLAANGVSISNASVGNDGLEGISYDPRNGGSFVTIKQDVPEDILAGTLSFAANLGGSASMTQLFNPAKLGLSTLSDVQVLSTVDSLAGTPGADNLLFLSLGSRLLVEADRNGNVLGSFDLTNVLPGQNVEGVTIDEHGHHLPGGRADPGRRRATRRAVATGRPDPDGCGARARQRGADAARRPRPGRRGPAPASTRRLIAGIIAPAPFAARPAMPEALGPAGCTQRLGGPFRRTAAAVPPASRWRTIRPPPGWPRPGRPAARRSRRCAGPVRPAPASARQGKPRPVNAGTSGR